MKILAAVLLIAGLWIGIAGAQPAPVGPVLVLDTAKGTIEIELFARDAPKSVEHIAGLVRRGFYRGLRFHRVIASLVQVGDPQTRDMSRQDAWGNGNSGSPIGVAEIAKQHRHVRGAVGLAYAGDPKSADSQFYIMKTANLALDGKYAVIGQVTKGIEVVDKLERGDAIKNASIKAEAGK